MHESLCFKRAMHIYIFFSPLLRNKEMPEDPFGALEWMVPKLLKDLSEAKILPIKLANLKHQDTLRHLMKWVCVEFYVFNCSSISKHPTIIYPAYSSLAIRWFADRAHQETWAILLRSEANFGCRSKGLLGSIVIQSYAQYLVYPQRKFIRFPEL